MDHSNAFWVICPNEDKLEQALKLLKEELFVLGYPAIRNCPTDLSNGVLAIDLINTTWNLTREVKRHRADKKDTQQNQSNQSQRNEQSQKELAKLQKKIDTLEKQNKELHNELQNASSCKAGAEKDSVLSREIIDKLKKMMDFNNHRYSINLRKKEMELRSLQNKYENFFKTGTRNSERKGDENDPNKGNTNDSSKQMELVEKSHRKIVSRLEETLEKLVGENLILRNLLEKLGKIIYNVHARISLMKGTPLENEELDIPDQLFQLSCEEIKEAMDSYFGSLAQNIETTFNEIIDKLSQQSDNSQ